MRSFVVGVVFPTSGSCWVVVGFAVGLGLVGWWVFGWFLDGEPPPWNFSSIFIRLRFLLEVLGSFLFWFWFPGFGWFAGIGFGWLGGLFILFVVFRFGLARGCILVWVFTPVFRF